MENNSCGYCGYKEETIPNSATVPPQPGQPFVQSQVIINNQTIPNPGVVPGVSKKNKMVALLLCIFLGVLGVHRFYVGKIGMHTAAASGRWCGGPAAAVRSE